MTETAEQTVQRLKEQHRQRSKRYYQKKRERKCDNDSDASSVVSLPSKRHHADDVSIPYEDVREAVYKALEEKEKEKVSKHGMGGLAMAGVGLAGICKALYDNLPALQAIVPKMQAFLPLGETSNETQNDLSMPLSSFSVPILLSAPQPFADANNDTQQTNDCGPTGSDVTTIIS